DLAAPIPTTIGESGKIVVGVLVQAFSFAAAANTRDKARVPLPLPDRDALSDYNRVSEGGTVPALVCNEWMHMGHPDADGLYSYEAAAAQLLSESWRPDSASGPARIKVYATVPESGTVGDLKEAVAEAWRVHWFRLHDKFWEGQDPPADVKLELGAFQLIHDTMKLTRKEDTLESHGILNRSDVRVAMSPGWSIVSEEGDSDEEGAAAARSETPVNSSGRHSSRRRSRPHRSTPGSHSVRRQRSASRSSSRSHSIPRGSSRGGRRAASSPGSDGSGAASPALASFGVQPGGSSIGNAVGAGREARWAEARRTRPWLPTAPPSGVVLVSPSEGDLLTMSKAEIKAVEGFAVRRPGVVMLRWRTAVDLSAVDLGQCLLMDEEEHGVDHDIAPSLANARADIVFEGVEHPADSTAEAFRQEHVELYRESGAEEVRYDVGARTLTVTVPHFSTWARPGSGVKRGRVHAFTPDKGRQPAGVPHTPGRLDMLQAIVAEAEAGRVREASLPPPVVTPLPTLPMPSPSQPLGRPGVRIAWGPGGRLAVPSGQRVALFKLQPLGTGTEEGCAAAAACVQQVVASSSLAAPQQTPVPVFAKDLSSDPPLRSRPAGALGCVFGAESLQALRSQLLRTAETSSSDTAAWAQHAAATVDLLDTLWGAAATPATSGGTGQPRLPYDTVSAAISDSFPVYRDWRGTMRRRDALLAWLQRTMPQALAQQPSPLAGAGGDLATAAEHALEAGYPRLGLILAGAHGDATASDLVNAQVESWLAAAEVGGGHTTVPAPVLRLLSVVARRLEDEVVGLEAEHWLVGFALFLRFGDAPRAPTLLVDALHLFTAAATAPDGQTAGSPRPWHGGGGDGTCDAWYRALQLAAEAELTGANAAAQNATSVPFPDTSLTALLTPQSWSPHALDATVPLLAHWALASARGYAYARAEAMPLPVLGARQTAVLTNTALAQLEGAGQWQAAVAVALLAASVDGQGCLPGAGPGQGLALDSPAAAFGAVGWSRVAHDILARHTAPAWTLQPLGDLPALPTPLAGLAIPTSWWAAAHAQAAQAAAGHLQPTAPLAPSLLRAMAAGGHSEVALAAWRSATLATLAGKCRSLARCLVRGASAAGDTAAEVDALAAALADVQGCLTPPAQEPVPRVVGQGSPAALRAVLDAAQMAAALVSGTRAWLADASPDVLQSAVAHLASAQAAQCASLPGLGDVAAPWEAVSAQAAALLRGRLVAPAA
ncbi:unnamed protein product, partial [Symbiodinium sp. KB8]